MRLVPIGAGCAVDSGSAALEAVAEVVDYTGGRPITSVCSGARSENVKVLMVFLVVVVLAAQGFCAGTAQTVGAAYPYLCSGVLKDAVLSRVPGQAIVTAGTIKLTQKDFDAAVAGYPVYQREQVKQYPVFVLEKAVSDKLITQEAEAWVKKDGRTITGSTLIDAYLTAKVPTPTIADVEVQEFYKANANMVGGAPFEQVKDVMRSFLLNEKTEAARDQFVNSAGKRHKILISEDWVKAQSEKWAGNPVEKARTSWKPSLIVFSVIGCCDKMHPVYSSINLKYADQVNAVFVNTREQTILSQLYGVSAIPVELILDAKGNEVFRNKGFMTEESLVAQFKAKGIDLKEIK